MRKIYLLLLTVAMTTIANAQLTGTKNIPGDYATLAAAITDLNTQGVGAGGVILNVLAGNPQTSPANIGTTGGGYIIGGAGSLVLTTTSAANPVTIQGNGNTITAPTGASPAGHVVGQVNDAIFKLIGADWITITGFTMQENAGNIITAAATNTMTEWGVALLYVTVTDGAQNNTIQSNTISLSRLYQNSFAIYSNTRHTNTSVTATADITNATGANSFNKIYGNTISNVNYGTVFVGSGALTAVGAMDNGTDIGGSSAITGNTYTNWGGIGTAISSYVGVTGSNYCIFVNNAYNDNISFNTITSATGTSAVTMGGILKNYSSGTTVQPTGTITTTINNNTVSVTNNPTVATTGGIIGINNQGLSPLLSTATMSMNNNTVQNCVLGGAVSTTNGITGITNLSLPGIMNMNGNSFINNAITATTATSGIINGMSNSGACGTLNMNNNILRNYASTATSGQIQGITNSGAVVTAINMNSNQIGNATGGFLTTSTATSGALFGVVSSGGATTCATTIQGNDIRGITYNLAASSAQNYIQSTAIVASSTISGNTFTNLTVNTTGTTTFISQTYSATSTGTKTVTNNSIVTAFNRTGASGSTLFVTDNGSSVTGSTSTCTNNNFSNVTVTGTSTVTGLNFTDGGTAPARTVTGNTFNNITAATGAINAINITYINGVSTVSNNTVTNLNGQAAITGITIGSTVNTGTTVTISGNTLNTYASTGTGGSVTGISCSNTSTGININGNTINTLSSTNTAGTVNGIAIGGSTTTNIFKNKIYDLSGNQTGTTVNGINVTSGTTLNINNNLIGDLRATAATGLNALNGINASATATYNVLHNTIYLNAASSSVTTFGTSCILFSSTATAFNSRNNILVNLSTPAQEGTNVATNGISAGLRRSTGTAATVPANYATTSNNNAYWVNPTAGTNNHLAYVEGTSSVTNPQNTVANMKSFMVNRDQSSVQENPTFVSTTGANAQYLHINTVVATQIESGGGNAGITDDFDGDTRNATTPDIGADEFTGIAADLTPPSISYTPLSAPDCTTGDRLLNGVIIADFSGVPTSGVLQPRIYYRKNAGTWFSSQGSLITGSGTNGTWNFTIVAADMGGLTGGDQIQYYVIAQDIATPINIASNPAGAVATDVNTVTTPPASPNIVYVGQSLGGTYTVGSGGNFPNLTVALSQYNSTCGLTAPVIFELLDASYTTGETFPLQINNATGASSTNTLTIRPTVVNTVISGANGTSIFTFNNAQYVTIDGRIGSSGSTHSLTITNTNTAAPAIMFINDATGGGIIYTDLKSDNTSTTSGVVLFSTTTGPNGNDNILIDNCNIGPNVANPSNGIYSLGTVTLPAQNNSNNTISNNNIFDWHNATASSGNIGGVILSSGNTDWSITGNSFYQTASRSYTSGVTVNGIFISNSSGNNFNVSNNFIGGAAPLCGGSAWTLTGAAILRAMQFTVGSTTATSIQGNTIQNISLTTSSTSTSQQLISLVTGSFNCGNITGNILGSGSLTGSITLNITGTGSLFRGISGGSGTPGNIVIANNTIGGITALATNIPQIQGIGIQGLATSYTISGNTIGSTAVANSISAASSAASFFGISSSATTTSPATIIQNNTVANVNYSGTGSYSVIGISSAGSTGGAYNVNSNTVRNLNSASSNVGSGNLASVIGISHSAATTAGQTVSQNTVYALSNSDATQAVGVTGISYTGPTTGTNVVSRNLVYDLTVASTSASADVRGINFNSGLANVQNNMVRIGNGITNGNIVTGLYEVAGTAGSGIYYNSVYVGGSGVGTQTGNSYAFRSDITTNARIFQNNIFMNARSNATTGGKHYAVRVAGTAANPAGLNLNYNDYFVSGTGGVFGFFNSADVATLAAWQTAVGQDALSLNVDPLYLAPTAATPNLHITSGSTTLESAANSITGINNDYDNDTRPGTPSGTNSGVGPDIGADEFDGLNPNLCTGTPSAAGTASASSPTICAGSNVTFTLTGATSGSGIAYQWQTSPAGTNTWTNVSGATSTVSAFPITGNTDVRCLVTCVPSGQTAINPTTVTVNGINCQFDVTKSTGITYNSISGTGTSNTGWRNTTTNTDDNMSTSQPIGFSFPYKGVNYTNFSMSTSGFITFNVGTASTGGGTGSYGYQNTQFTSTTGTLNALAPFYEDLVTSGNPGTLAGLNAAMKYQVDGIAPNRVLTVEWIGMETFNNAGPNLNFQIKLYETTGLIEYVYGTMEGFNGTSNFTYTYSMGLNGPTISAVPTVPELQAQQVENVQNFSNIAANALNRVSDCNIKYTFTPGNYSGPAGSPGVPTNDETATPILLQVNSSPCASFCGTYYTSRNATASAGTTVCNAGTPGTPDDDVWFTFVATTTDQTITVRGAGGYDPVVQLFSDAGITSITCVNATATGLTETINASGLTVSNTYYVRVYHSGAGSGTNGDFSICVNEVVLPPSNDNPCGAYGLTVGSTCTPYSDNTIDRKTAFITATTTTTNGVVTPTCSGAGATVNDVWFSFIAPASGSANIDVIPVAGVNPAIQIYSASGTCPSTLALTPLGCINSAGTGGAEQTVATSLTGGATYYIRVYQHPSGTGGAPVSNSQFSICVYAPMPGCPATFTPANASSVCESGTATTLSWTAGTNATGYDVYFDAGAGPATTLVSPNQAGLTYSAGVLSAGQYSWRIESKNANGTTVCSNLTFTVNAAPSINITPVGPINLCAPTSSQTLSLGATSATTPSYQWKNGGVNISGATSTTYNATSSGVYTLQVTDGVTGCVGLSNAVSVTFNPQPTLSVNPTAVTICSGSSTAITATASVGSFTAIKFTEVTLFRTGTGQTVSYPAYITGADLVEISNISASPVDVSGLTFGDYADNSSTANHPYTIPAATIIPANGVLVLHLGTGTDDATNRYFNTGGTLDSWSSGSLVGFVLKSGSAIIDVVGLNSGYVFNAATGVTGSDWSGFASSPGTFAGTIRSATTDNNIGADWVQSNTPTPLQTIGTYNGGYTSTSSLTYLWTPASGLFTDAGLTIPYTNQNIATVYASPSTSTTYNVLVTSGAGCTNNANSIVTVIPPNTLEWTGAINTDWNNAGNWTCNTLPTTTTNVLIKSGLTNYPVIAVNVDIKSLTTQPGASVTVNTGFTLLINGL